MLRRPCLICPGLGFLAEYDTRDFWSNPRKGWWNNFEIVRNGGFLGADGDFWTVNVDARRYQPVQGKHGLAFFSLTTIQTGKVNVELPVYRRFHLVRGWDLNARSGKNQFINSVEYRYEILHPRSFRVFGLRLYGGAHLAAFGDLGTAWDRGDDFSRNFIGSGGFGLRLIVPFVNLIRFDVALGQRGEGIRFHLGIREKAIEQRRRVR